ncbi:shikimate dehydrogenase [Alkalibaculum bacchi]|uniref:Shikimate dehydrogenase (NADP(+)) n=1 Tax=Alkalibaculum bacchi TaxID=645887 RepID=A0A366I6J1_9FIRM|nr:shikimate dehydrogenase [Alkalibaculum bacchi]RBP64412.1 shikimate dehydrogenase [Alkalibaculum bacchi]
MEKLFGLIGEKLGHTYSPIINSKIMEEININGHYGTFQVNNENLKDVIPGLKALGYNGINVTIPYKTDIIKYLDKLSPEAEKIGAINVVAIGRDKMATGYNTDYYGFGMMLENANIKISGENAVILGTGGASKAVAEYLKDNEIKQIIFVTRDVATAKQKFPEDEIVSYDEFEKIENCSTIINATPVGMFPNIEATPIDKKYLMGFSQAVDLIYNPSETVFIRQSREAGLKSVNGLYMLVAQAIKSQEIWNEVEISDETIIKILAFLKQEYL